MTFSDKIKVAREQAGLTQQQLADSTGVSKRTIASYESGGAIARASTMLMSTISSETMLRCSQVVNCPRNRKTSSLRRSCGRMSPARMKQR